MPNSNHQCSIFSTSVPDTIPPADTFASDSFRSLSLLLSWADVASPPLGVDGAASAVDRKSYF